ncbi:MAG: HlyD family efflux transporter periplasmic adaptor subunit [Anaerolineales bacterium]|nr:HlyD family efflux transporter periplasmic adaptor subunit [Anaerolineales bacterium]
MKHIKLLAIIILALTIAACGTATATPQATQIPTVIADNTIIAEGRVEPIQYAEIAFNASGAISEVLVKEGQLVKKGDPLIRLGGESDTNYAAAQVELASAQKAWDDLLNSRDADFAQAVIELKEARKASEKAYQYLVYLQNDKKIPQTQSRRVLTNTPYGYQYEIKTKSFKGPAPQDWIVEAENNLALKKAELEKAQRAYDRLKEGPDADQLPILEARLNAAKAGVAAFSVIAPFDGVVAKLNAKTGGTINAGEIAVTIADTSNWIVVTTDMTEIDVVKLKEGQPVTVRLDAIPDVELKGNVLSIGNNYTINQGDVVYEAIILLTDKDAAMRWGMTAVVTFE